MNNTFSQSVWNILQQFCSLKFLVCVYNNKSFKFYFIKLFDRKSGFSSNKRNDWMKWKVFFSNIFSMAVH